jgi:hypothetical protein
MRKSALSAAILALSIAVPLYAHDDFDALLADLSFGEVTPQNGPAKESLKVIEDETLRDLFPMPAGMSTPGMLESSPDPESVVSSASTIAREPQVMPAPAPQVALMDPIVNEVPVKTIDFGTAFTLDSGLSAPVTTVGHHPQQACETGDCASGNCGDGYHHAGSGVCRPRGTVNLPSSTLYEYFRSHPCYTNVWDGYGIYCGSHHKHLHGECDCFKNSGRGCSNGKNCDTCGSR